jgi:hypothetical protein
LTLTPAFAADPKGNFTVISLGTKTCGQVVADFDKDDWGKLSNSVWVGGYLTAINSEVFVGADVAKGTDPAARDLWIYNYCKTNPLNNLYRATDALVTELSRRAK